MGSHRIVRLKHSKASQRCGHTDRRKSRMPGGRKRTAVIHCCAHGDACRHLVVQQSPNLCPKNFFDRDVSHIIASVGISVDPASQITLQQFADLEHLIQGFGQNKQRTVSEGFCLEDKRICKELAARHAHQRILETDALAAAWMTAGHQ